MEVQHGKHVIITINLKEGDKVKTDNWGSKMDDKVYTIKKIEYTGRSQSGFMVTLDSDVHIVLDSDWLDKV